MSINQNNLYYMNLALKQARRGLGKTSTNPSVGCVIVKNNHVLNSAYTGFNGRPHAEHIALGRSLKNIKNSLMYTTLEPCSHYGKTPPCVNSIIKSRIKKVFFSVNDLDIRSFNKCKKKLNKFGIQVYEGILRKKINEFYVDYKNKKLNRLPFVSSKLAISKDYYSINKKSKWLTNLYSRGRVHLLRSEHDCILTSIKTVLKDNPMLNCRVKGLEKFSPTRIILDKKLKILLSSRIVSTAKRYKTIIFYNTANNSKIEQLQRKRIRCIKTKLDSKKHIDIQFLLKKISKLGYSRVFLEAGMNLTHTFLKLNLINSFYLFKSNNKLRQNGKNSIKKIIDLLNINKINFKIEPINLINDKLLIYKIK